MRPNILHVGGTLFWVIRTRNPDTQVLKDADSTPTVAIRKNGASTGDSVTVTKRSATTGIYDCSYNPAGEVEGDEFTVEESATVTGTTTAQATYANSWAFTVLAVERGTDGANTTTPPTAAAVADQVQTRTIARVTLVDTCTTNTDMRGTNGALTSLGTNAPAGWLNTAAFADGAITAAKFASGAFDAVWSVTTRTLSAFGFNVTLATSQPNYAPAKASDVQVTVTPTINPTVLSSGSVDAIRDGLATSQNVLDSQGVITDAIDAIDGGGGGASAEDIAAIKAKTDLITSQTANQTRTPVNTLTIRRGDSFTGTHAVTTNYTGYTATFTIRHRVTDAVLCSASATVTSSTVLTVTLTTTDTAFALLVDPSEFGSHPYDIQLVNGSTQKTESGVAIITRDATRT